MVSTYHNNDFKIGKYIMKNHEFFITEESFSRAKKQLKKTLKNEGLEVSLSKSADFIAKSFGFNDEHHIQSFINNQKKLKIKNIIIDDFPFYHNVSEQEKDYFNKVIEIWYDVLTYIKGNIPNIIKNTEKLESEETIQIIKSISRTINTAEYMIQNRLSILHGNIWLRETGVDLFAMAFTRHTMLSLSKLTRDNNYRTFYNLMDAYHNIEEYFYLSHEMRKDFWLQPKDFKSESSYVKEQKPFYNKIENKELLDLKGNIMVFGNVGTGKNTYAKSLIQALLIEGNEDISKIKIIDICDYMSLPENKSPYFIPAQIMGLKYIYTANASNIVELKEKIMEQNPLYNFNDIQYFIDVNFNKDRIEPKILVNKSFDPYFKPRTKY